MPKCINTPLKNFTGYESSPLGLGYSATVEKDGKLMIGKDEDLWYVRQKGNSKMWFKYSYYFSDFTEDCIKEAYLPVIKEIKEFDETGREEKFGGTKPFFIEGEKWPKDIDGNPLVFFCQFKDPRVSNNILYRVFIGVDNTDDYEFENKWITKIELNQENINKQIILIKPETILKENNIFNCNVIKEWNKKNEFASFEYIRNKFNIPNYNDDKKVYRKFYDIYESHDLYPSNKIKVGGTPMSCQDPEHVKSYTLLQMTDSHILPYQWGDCGIAHIDNECNLIWDCC